MRLPLLPILLVLLLAAAIDWRIWKLMRKRLPASSFWVRLQFYSAIGLNMALLVTICMPKRSGTDAALDSVMWALYTYFSIYIPKLIFVIFDLMASLPRIWHRNRLKWLDWSGAIIGILVFLTMWWGALINRYDIDVRNVEIVIPNLPEAFDGYTIAQISDLHVGTYGSDTAYVSHVVDKVNSLGADMIAFTGDIVNRRTSELDPFEATLSRLNAPDGVISILGNHDYGDYYDWNSEEAKQQNMSDMLRAQARMGWRMLNNDHFFLHRQSDSIAIIGVENVGDPPFNTYGDLDAAYPELADPNVKILLSHNPAHWNDDISGAPDKNIALTLAGHTHAMQMSAFGVSPAALRYPTWGGLYADQDGHQLYVNIGIGEVAIPARIGATPEITLITLRK